MPGDREHVVKLNADHSGLCKFGSGQIDQDNFKLVQSNIKDLYNIALKHCKYIYFSFLVRKEEALCTGTDFKGVSQVEADKGFGSLIMNVNWNTYYLSFQYMSTVSPILIAYGYF